MGSTVGVPDLGGRSHVPPSPVDLDAIAEWFDTVSLRLVLLADFPRDEVGAAVERFARAVSDHLDSVPPPVDAASATERERLLASDHVRFRTSVEQLVGFYPVIEREDHGGHRQALGQYGRVFVESFRRHRRDEGPRLEAAPPGRSARSQGGPPKQR